MVLNGRNQMARENRTSRSRRKDHVSMIRLRIYIACGSPSTPEVAHILSRSLIESTSSQHHGTATAVPAEADTRQQTAKGYLVELPAELRHGI